ncbi:MAG: hypothetical protein A2033_03340 [Bacteroidetes bacterium GWA2_31_9]|nr:MAG: hypothetical protein A2033_03340 [Bacteroidetes bacterium GWA2_31_9]
MLRTQIQTVSPNIRDAFILLFKTLPKEIQEDIKNELLTVTRKNKSATPTVNNIAEQFEHLSSELLEEFMMVSSPSQIALHPFYQKIIAMGEKAIPFLIKKLDETPTMWFWALEEISGDNPVSVSDKGNIPLMVSLWKKWAKNKGYAKR